METLFLLWTFAPELKLKLAILVLLLQMAISIWCYMKMGKARAGAAKSGKISPEIYRAVGDAEPEEIRVYTRLVANQFESPILFYTIVIASLAIGVTSWLTIALGLIYCVYRFLHAREMMGVHLILRRRKLFIRSLQTLMFLMAELGCSTLIFI